MPRVGDVMRIFKDGDDAVLASADAVRRVEGFDFDGLFRSVDSRKFLEGCFLGGEECAACEDLGARKWDAPLGSQEVWASGVTYFRSRTARMEESEEAGGAEFYDLVYAAERPELFFKATARRARGHRDLIRIRADSSWDVPEPELTLAINSGGKVFGYTVGNDVSSRSIEGENPLYLPQAKVYRGSCALGPCLVVPDDVPDDATRIALTIRRGGAVVFEGETGLAQMKRSLVELADWLFRENEFPDGALLMTGTGVVPGTDFSLTSGDEVAVAIDGIGELVNVVE